MLQNANNIVMIIPYCLGLFIASLIVSDNSIACFTQVQSDYIFLRYWPGIICTLSATSRLFSTFLHHVADSN